VFHTDTLPSTVVAKSLESSPKHAWKGLARGLKRGSDGGLEWGMEDYKEA